VLLDKKLPAGTVMFFDEFYSQEAAAFAMYLRMCGREYEMIASRKDHVKLALKLTK